MKASELFELIDEAGREGTVIRAANALFLYAHEHREELLRLDLAQAAREYVAREWRHPSEPPTQVTFEPGACSPYSLHCRTGEWFVIVGRDWKPE